MRKIDMFEKMYEIDMERKNSIQAYGEKHPYTKFADAEYWGARAVIEAAGLFNDYFDFKMKKMRG